MEVKKKLSLNFVLNEESSREVTPVSYAHKTLHAPIGTPRPIYKSDLDWTSRSDWGFWKKKSYLKLSFAGVLLSVNKNGHFQISNLG